MPEGKRITDPQVLKAMAHPIRQKLLRLLIQLGPSTVGTLAKKVDGDPGQISYHLREMAKHGFIESANELSRDLRQSWWRVTDEPISWSSLDFESPAARAVAATTKAQWTVEQFQAVRDYERSKDALPRQWQEVAVASQSFFFLTPAEVKEMTDELHELSQRWAKRGKAADNTDADRGHVRFFFHTFPEQP